MSKDFASLMAQVIPVILLALILQTDQMVKRISGDRRKLREDMNSLQVTLDETAHEARQLLVRAGEAGDVELVRQAAEVVERAQENVRRQKKNVSMWARSGPTAQLTMSMLIATQGTAGALLGAGEVLALRRASGLGVPSWSGSVLQGVIGGALIFLVAAPVGTWAIDVATDRQRSGETVAKRIWIIPTSLVAVWIGVLAAIALLAH